MNSHIENFEEDDIKLLAFVRLFMIISVHFSSIVVCVMEFPGQKYYALGSVPYDIWDCETR